MGRMPHAQGTPELSISGAVDALKGYGARLTTTEAAKVLNRTPRRIRAMIQTGIIFGTLHGRDYLISVGDVQKVLDKRESKRARIESEKAGKLK